ncbi:CD225/dispanin family protein [Streptomyces lydicus]|uniref:CD225/dispanin family protein n=1 Tax=Streptomyces lydicus TaxID=47763 RepID=UPI003799EDE7
MVTGIMPQHPYGKGVLPMLRVHHTHTNGGFRAGFPTSTARDARCAAPPHPPARKKAPPRPCDQGRREAEKARPTTTGPPPAPEVRLRYPPSPSPYSSQVNTRWRYGDVAGAKQASKSALIVNLIGIGVGLLFWILVIATGS